MMRQTIVARIRARAPTYWRYTREQPSWVAMFAAARFPAARRIERWISRASYRRPVAAPGSIFGELDLAEVVRQLADNGVYLGLKLPEAIVREIREFAESHPCSSRDKPDAGFLPKDVAIANSERDRDVVAAHYFESVIQSPTITKLQQDPALLSIANAYIGQQAMLIRTRLWWNFPASRVTDADLRAAAQEGFHFDMNGWRTLKFFFYLTPTDERSGPHRCIVGSHKNRPLRHQFTLTVGRPTAELQGIYGQDQFLTITGDAGTGFAEDPFVFHTGSLCQDEPRLILELEYGSKPPGPSYRYGRMG
jgi:hypothetical protein